MLRTNVIFLYLRLCFLLNINAMRLQVSLLHNSRLQAQGYCFKDAAKFCPAWGSQLEQGIICSAPENTEREKYNLIHVK